MTPEEKYEYYLRNNNYGERILEVITISHSQLPQDYHLVKEPGGATVTIGGEPIQCMGVNLDIKRSEYSASSTDEKFTITIADSSGQIQDAVDEIAVDDQERFMVTYRVYMASDTTAAALDPILLECTAIAFIAGSVSFECESPSITQTRTGELYTFERFPTLKAFA